MDCYRKGDKGLKKKICRWIRRAFYCILLYEVLGGILPYIIQPKVSENTKENWSVDTVYGGEEDAEQVLLIEDNLQAWKERLRLFNMAQTSICMSSFDFRDDESGKDMLAALLDAADRGVKIKLLVDGFSAFTHMEGSNYFVALSSHKNVELKLYNPVNVLTPWTIQGRMHDKYIIIDESCFVLGGRNTYDFFLGDYPTKHENYDRELLVWNVSGDSSALAQMEAYFEEVWNLPCSKIWKSDEKYARKSEVIAAREELAQRFMQRKEENPELYEAYDYTDVCLLAKKITLLSNPTKTGAKEPILLYQLGQIMLTATECVDIHTPYAICNEYMYQILESVAVQTDKSRIVINGSDNGGNYFAIADYLNHKQDLIDTGIDIYEYEGGVSYHGKSILVDERLSIVGSFNYDMRSVYLDTELMLVVDSEALNQKLSDYFEEIEKDCRIVENRLEYTEETQTIQTTKTRTWKEKAFISLIRLFSEPFRFLFARTVQQ